MTTISLPAPEATRLHRPSWRDRRVIVGVLLVLASVALGAQVVSAADRTVPVYAARDALPVGSTLQAEALTVVRVRLTTAQDRYLSAERALPQGQVLTRSVGPGELVPLSALTRSEVFDLRPLGVPVDVLPAGLAAGGRVDVWASPRDRKIGPNAFGPPERLVSSAEVFAITEPTTGLGAGRGGTVQVLLDGGALARVLAAQADGSRTTVLPVPGTAPQGSRP